jgi:hypothetical protein
MTSSRLVIFLYKIVGCKILMLSAILFYVDAVDAICTLSLNYVLVLSLSVAFISSKHYHVFAWSFS